MLAVIANNNVNKKDDPISVIALSPTEVPENIKTVDPNARLVFSALKEIPYVHCVSRTIHSYNYYRYDWLRVDRSTFIDLVGGLMIGDIILYHDKRSLIGWCIRFLTRCYWEHTAIYMGNGYIVEAVPAGVIKTRISDWLADAHIDIAVLRRKMNDEQTAELCEFVETIIGRKYNYLGVLKKFWVIVTGKSCDGIMTPVIFFTNLLLVSIVIYHSFANPELPRVGILLLLISSIYMFDCIYHWLAYNPKLTSLFESLNEKSRN